MKTYLKRIMMSVLIAAMLTGSAPVPVSAATVNKTVKKAAYTTKTSKAKKTAKKVVKGTTVLKVAQGFVKFTAPSAGNYMFTFSKVKRLSSNGFSVGTVQIMSTYGSKDQFLEPRKVKTEGGKNYRLYLCTGEFYSSWKPTKITKLTNLAKRSGTTKLKKDQTVYIFVDFGDGPKNTVKLNIKKTG